MTIPDALGPLKRGEEKILAEMGGRDPIVVGPALPEHGDGDAEVRAEFLVHLLVRKGDAIGHRGLHLCGAWISGEFDVAGATIGCRLYFEDCRFERVLCFNDAEIRTLFMHGVSCPGIRADGVEVRGALVLGRGFDASGPVRFLGARIHGSFECEEAVFYDGCSSPENETHALSLERTRVDGALLLRDGFKAQGSVRLYQVEVGGNLEIRKAKFYGPSVLGKAEDGGHESGPPITHPAIDLEKAVVKGSVLAKEDVYVSGGIRLYEATVRSFVLGDAAIYRDSAEMAFDARLAKFEGALLIMGDVIFEGRVQLSQASAQVVLIDNWAWPKGETVLDGFTYDRFADSAILRYADTIEWLMCQPEDHFDNFRPQPWDQCARVLTQMGHAAEATRVMIAKERLRLSRIRRQCGPAKAAFLLIGHVILDEAIRFGYRPLRAGLWLCLMVSLGWGLFWCADAQAALEPAVKDPPAFHALIFALDSFVPIIKLGQADAFRASAASGTWFWHWVIWIYQLLGWALAGLWVAGFTGLVKK